MHLLMVVLVLFAAAVMLGSLELARRAAAGRNMERSFETVRQTSSTTEPVAQQPSVRRNITWRHLGLEAPRPTVGLPEAHRRAS